MATRYSVKQIRELPNGLHKIEKGLFIYAFNNRRTWQYFYSFDGRQRKLSLGSAIDVPLSVAKQLKDQAQAQVLNGINPVEERKKGIPIKEMGVPILFKDFWRPVFERIKAVKRWKNAKHADQWVNTITTYALPVLGNLRVSEITRDDILKVLEPIWASKNETAARLRGRLETILGYAVMDGTLKSNPALWKSNLDFFLASKADVQSVIHHEAVHHADLKGRIKEFDYKRHSGQALIVFTILTACRIGESAPAKWCEIDFEKKVWSIPPARRKDKKKEVHRVPLSDVAVEILEGLPKLSEYVFASKRKATHLSRESPRVMIQRRFNSGATMHGMRSTFRDWCAENGVSDIVAEKCLMHAVGNEVQQAYQRSDLLEQRRVVMQKWADYLFK